MQNLKAEGNQNQNNKQPKLQNHVQTGFAFPFFCAQNSQTNLSNPVISSNNYFYEVLNTFQPLNEFDRKQSDNVSNIFKTIEHNQLEIDEEDQLLLRTQDGSHLVDSIIEFKRTKFGTASFKLSMCCDCRFQWCKPNRSIWFNKQRILEQANQALIRLAEQTEDFYSNGVDIKSLKEIHNKNENDKRDENFNFMDLEDLQNDQRELDQNQFSQNFYINQANFPRRGTNPSRHRQNLIIFTESSNNLNNQKSKIPQEAIETKQQRHKNDTLSIVQFEEDPFSGFTRSLNLRTNSNKITQDAQMFETDYQSPSIIQTQNKSLNDDQQQIIQSFDQVQINQHYNCQECKARCFNQKNCCKLSERKKQKTSLRSLSEDKQSSNKQKEQPNNICQCCQESNRPSHFNKKNFKDFQIKRQNNNPYFLARDSDYSQAGEINSCSREFVFSSTASMANILDYNDDEISQNKNPKKYKKRKQDIIGDQQCIETQMDEESDFFQIQDVIRQQSVFAYENKAGKLQTTFTGHLSEITNDDEVLTYDGEEDSDKQKSSKQESQIIQKQFQEQLQETSRITLSRTFSKIDKIKQDLYDSDSSMKHISVDQQNRKRKRQQDNLFEKPLCKLAKIWNNQEIKKRMYEN